MRAVFGSGLSYGSVGRSARTNAFEVVFRVMVRYRVPVLGALRIFLESVARLLWGDSLPPRSRTMAAVVRTCNQCIEYSNTLVRRVVQFIVSGGQEDNGRLQ